MKVDEARAALLAAQDEDEPAALPSSILSKLTIDDVREGSSLRIGTFKGGILHLDWSGNFYRRGQHRKGTEHISI